MPEPRRWTLLVCPVCGACEGLDLYDEVQFCLHGPEPTVMQAVEVVPRSVAEDEFEIRCAEERTTAALCVELDLLHARLRKIEPAEQRMRAVLGYMADETNWLGNPHDVDATIHGHFTPYELAMEALAETSPVDQELRVDVAPSRHGEPGVANRADAASKRHRGITNPPVCTCTRLGYGERDPQVDCPVHGITHPAGGKQHG